MEDPILVRKSNTVFRKLGETCGIETIWIIVRGEVQ